MKRREHNPSYIMMAPPRDLDTAGNQDEGLRRDTAEGAGRHRSGGRIEGSNAIAIERRLEREVESSECLDRGQSGHLQRRLDAPALADRPQQATLRSPR